MGSWDTCIYMRKVSCVPSTNARARSGYKKYEVGVKLQKMKGRYTWKWHEGIPVPVTQVTWRPEFIRLRPILCWKQTVVSLASLRRLEKAKESLTVIVDSRSIYHNLSTSRNKHSSAALRFSSRLIVYFKERGWSGHRSSRCWKCCWNGNIGIFNAFSGYFG